MWQTFRLQGNLWGDYIYPQVTAYTPLPGLPMTPGSNGDLLTWKPHNMDVTPRKRQSMAPDNFFHLGMKYGKHILIFDFLPFPICSSLGVQT